MAKVDTDLLNNASSKATADACYALVDGLQNHPAHIQAAASAVLFLTVSKTLGVDPVHVFTVVTNMMADTIHGEQPSFRALRLYAQHEIGA